MPPPKPSLDLLRALTDEHVLRALMQERRLTRAELAVHTGISKPTVSESVRRLAEVGLLSDTGERTTGRGRIGSYYALSADVGCALVVSIAPEGVVAESLDAYGDVIARTDRAVQRPARPAQVARALKAAARAAAGAAQAPIRLAVVSAADPVDRTTGRLVHLPDAPFLVGEVSPVEVLNGVVDGPVLVDNDVNWAALAERESADGEGATALQLDDFAYLFLGEGLGCAVVSDGDVRRGSTGIAGEIAHLLTVGARGRAVHFIDIFDELGLRRAGSTAIDVDALLKTLQRKDSRGRAVREALANAISGVLAAIVALTDPRLIVIGGTWGAMPSVLDSVGAAFEMLPRHVAIQAASVTVEPSLVGARQQALRDLRAEIVLSTHS
ncbi:MAG: ROK family protein [Acidothermaceae bacterium]